MNLDESHIASLIDKIVDKVIERIANHADESGALDAHEEDYEGTGPAFAPSVVGAESDLPVEGEPEPDGDEDGPDMDGDGDGFGEGEEGEPVLDDLDEDEDDEDEGDDMDQPLSETQPLSKAAPQKEKNCSNVEPAPRDAKRKREKYQADFARFREDFDAKIARYQSENKALREEINLIKAESEYNRRKSLLDTLVLEGYEVQPDRELQRTQRYSADGFDAHVELIRENYRKSDTVPDFIPVSAATGIFDDEANVNPEDIYQASLTLSDLPGDPSVRAARAVAKYNADRKLARG